MKELQINIRLPFAAPCPAMDNGPDNRGDVVGVLREGPGCMSPALPERVVVTVELGEAAVSAVGVVGDGIHGEPEPSKSASADKWENLRERLFDLDEGIYSRERLAERLGISITSEHDKILFCRLMERFVGCVYRGKCLERSFAVSPGTVPEVRWTMKSTEEAAN